MIETKTAKIAVAELTEAVVEVITIDQIPKKDIKHPMCRRSKRKMLNRTSRRLNHQLLKPRRNPKQYSLMTWQRFSEQEE
jgi:3-oxoacyl-[acyl-carrier-protein] synthase III